MLNFFRNENNYLGLFILSIGQMAKIIERHSDQRLTMCLGLCFMLFVHYTFNRHDPQ